MSVLKSIVVAFSIYSKIPVPIFDWKEENMKYHLIFFPWIGAVIGVIVYLWNLLCTRFGIGIVAYTLIGAAIPLIVTGGFHLDGFMDTKDAFSSYKPKEEKLKILKDPHIGAFAVISFAIVGLIYTAAFSEIEKSVIGTFVVSFFVARTLSAIAAVSFVSAKGDGMLYTFAEAGKKVKTRVLVFLAVELLAGYGLMIFLNIRAGIVLAAGSLLCFLYYRYRSYKEIGGITGDTEGYFVVVCETLLAVMAAVMKYV